MINSLALEGMQILTDEAKEKYEQHLLLVEEEMCLMTHDIDRPGENLAELIKTSSALWWEYIGCLDDLMVAHNAQ